MECREGIIEKIDDAKIYITVKRNPMCAHCKAKESCIDSSEGDRVINIEVSRDRISEEDYKTGDKVLIEYKSSKFLLDTVFAYLIPSTAIIIAVIMSQFVSIIDNTDINGGIFFVFGLIIGIIILVIYEKLNKKNNKLKITIKKS